MNDWDRINYLSRLSLWRPLEDDEYKEMMALRDKLNIKSGEIPKIGDEDDC